MDSTTIKTLIKDYRTVLLLSLVLLSLTERTLASPRSESAELSEDMIMRYCSYNALDPICRHVRTTKRNVERSVLPFIEENLSEPKDKKIDCRKHIMNRACRGAFIAKKKSVDFGEDYDFKMRPMEGGSGQTFNNPLLGKLLRLSVMDGTSDEYDAGNYIK